MYRVFALSFFYFFIEKGYDYSVIYIGIFDTKNSKITPLS